MKRFILLNAIILGSLFQTTLNAQYTGGSADGSGSVIVQATLGTGSIAAPTVSGDTICTGSTATLIATAPGGTYNWYTVPVAGAPIFTGSTFITPPLFSTTTYYVETTMAGCTSPRTPVVVTVYQMPVIAISNDSAICAGQAITITATGGAQYNWTSNPVGFTSTQSSIAVTPSVTTTYYVSVSNGFCVANDSVAVTVNQLPVIVLSNDTTICAGQNVQLVAGGGTQYSWTSNPVGFTSTQAVITVAPSVTTTYYVSVSDGTCSANDSVVITANPLPVIALSNDSTICEGQTIQLVAAGGTQYSWTSNPVGFVSAQPQVFVSPTLTTTYYISVSNGVCSSNDSVIVAVNPLPVITLSNDTTICSGPAIQLYATGGTQYSWTSNPVGFTSAQSQIFVSPSVTTTYYVTATNTMCSSNDSVVVTINSPFTILISGTDSICPGETISLIATGGTTYSWSSNPVGFASTSDTVQVSPTINTVYYVTSTVGQCMSADSFSVSISPLPVISINSPASVCIGEQAILTAAGGQSYLWNTGAPGSVLSVNPLVTTTYWVTVTTPGNCSATDSATVLVVPPPVAMISGATATCKGTASTLTAVGGTSYLWNTGESSSSITILPTISTTYSVTVSNGVCSDTVSARIEILDEESTLFIPNVFTPDGDGTNEIFMAGVTGINNFQGMIYNRWGELLFTWNDPSGGWDGMYKGNMVAEGVYVYVITGNTMCNDEVTRRGAVTVLR